MAKLFYLDDLPGLRRKLQRAEESGALLGKIWAAVRRRGRASPRGFPWFAPFIAAITGEPADIEAAKGVIRNYIATLEPQTFGMGLQFHFWCFAFPHARWSLYFQWLAALGAWDKAEEREIREQLLVYQFVNFFYGMRTKPEPECVDNQTLSLCFSNALLGYIFGRGSGAACALAERMYRDGIRRLPAMLGGMPASGYSGEGSTY
ncbi:MAG: hypothetical protein N3A66_09260, partial [Planctomycetota bacterium]|nr:hypothetical protein [Planctomycetota bacterium]